MMIVGELSLWGSGVYFMKKLRKDLSLFIIALLSTICFFFWIYEIKERFGNSNTYIRFELISLMLLSAVIAVFAMLGSRYYTFVGIMIYFIVRSIEYINNFDDIIEKFKFAKKLTDEKDIREKLFALFDAIFGIAVIVLALLLIAMLAIIFITNNKGYATVVMLFSAITGMIGICRNIFDIVRNYNTDNMSKEFIVRNIIEIIYILLFTAVLIFTCISIKDYRSRFSIRKNK